MNDLQNIALPTFLTRDIQLVATLKTLDTPKVIVVHYNPVIVASGVNRRPRTWVEMHLCVADDDGNACDGREVIKELQNKYLNGLYKVEPRRLLSEMRDLRVIVADIVRKQNIKNKEQEHGRAEDNTGSISTANIQSVLDKHPGC